MTIHWCGTGLSAIPGLRRVLGKGFEVEVWNRTKSKAVDAVGDLTKRINVFDQNKLKHNLKKGDLVVSMLPGDWHVPLAELCISKRANFVSSSYISPEMQALDQKAKSFGVVLVNEIGLDPGLDHLMAHNIVDKYRDSPANNPKNVLSFISYCGGIPKIANDFRYKFSWSPYGVLKALKSPSKSIKNFKEFDTDRPWDAISTFASPLNSGEIFEVYPNRNSLPFIKQYKFDTQWKIKEFVRGTLRLKGWANAWKPVFKEIEGLEQGIEQDRLKEMSEKLWKQHAYAEDEPDRVVLCVSLKAEKNTEIVWHKTFVLDAWGDNRGTAMARLVSYPVSFAVEEVCNGSFSPGVHAATQDKKIISNWLKNIKDQAQYLELIDNIAKQD